MVRQIFKASPIGVKIEGIRKIKNVSQDSLANLLGVSRQTLLNWEQTENLEADKLEQIAKALDVSVEAIKNYSEEAVMTYIQNNYERGNSANFFGDNTSYHNNPLDNIMDLVEENRKLYQQLIQSEKEKVAMLQKMLDLK